MGDEWRCLSGVNARKKHKDSITHLENHHCLPYNNHIINIVDNRIGRFPRLTKDTFLMNPPFIITNGYEPLFLPKLNIIFENYYQPNANSEKAENLKNLPKNFYNELSDLVDESYKNRFLLTDKGEK